MTTPDHLDGVLLDFAGTLFHDEDPVECLRAIGVPAADHLALLAAAESGFVSLERLCAADRVFARQWARCDLDPRAHRAAFTGLLIRAGIPEDIAVPWYNRCVSPAGWQPYPDTAPVLRQLRAAGIAVAIVSNIGWDLRPVLAAAGLDDLVDFCALSCEQGMMKPDPRLFEIACQEMGAAPERTVMIGDDLPSDSGATAIGCRFVLVDAGRRDSSLTTALGLPGTDGGPKEKR